MDIQFSYRIDNRKIVSRRRLVRALTQCILSLFVLGFATQGLAAPYDRDADAELAGLAISNAAHLAIAPSGRLYVADADNNQVLSWPDAATFSTGAAPDLVIGQPGLDASSFILPQGLDVDDQGNLWVADAFNSRVLKFNDPATTDGVADLVIGQPDFVSGSGNLELEETGATADSLHFPGRVLVNGTDVYIADSANSRVLHYANPTTNKPFADRVFGQYDDFAMLWKNSDGTGNCPLGEGSPCGPPTAQNLFNPIGLALDEQGSLYVADWNNHRVLRFDDPLTTDTTADAVFGQTNLASNVSNSGGLLTGLSNPIDLAFDAFGRLYVADSTNNRVLVYREPLTNPTSPDFVFGQSDNLLTAGFGTGVGALDGPTAVAIDLLSNVYIVDTNNLRAMRFDLPFTGEPPVDFDADQDVDLDDFAAIVGCIMGPMAGPPDSSCIHTNIDDLGDVDLRDLALFQNCVSGKDQSADRDCLNN